MQNEFTLRPVRRDDDPALARVIRAVMEEYGATGAGSSYHDAEVDAISVAYAGGRAAYFVTDGERVLGGGGIGPLAGDASGRTCELRKMYFLPEARGRGFGRSVVELCLEAARGAGYETCYLETMSSMKEARRLYERAGFRPTGRPLGDTGHFGCDAWMRLEL
jgi:putative acetyltransferase